jgi:phosphopantothenoylcysteine decarboxylase/phosphopantothenate--cysteine ligase
MTPNAARLIGPQAFSALTGNRTIVDAFESHSDSAMEHIEQAKWADIYLIAPCTANTIGEMANGITNSLVSMIYLTFQGKVYIAPAMNPAMLASPAVKENLKKLARYGTAVLPTGTGILACNETGPGKLLDPEGIIGYLNAGEALSSSYPRLRNKKCLIAMGSTEESIDSVRHISNRSSGKTGLALARALKLCGAKIKIVCGKIDVPISNEYSDTEHPGFQKCCKRTNDKQRYYNSGRCFSGFHSEKPIQWQT